MGFRIVTGRGRLVAPGITKVRTLRWRRTRARSSCRASASRRSGSTSRGVVVYKVGDDYRSIANAARRFLDRPAAGARDQGAERLRRPPARHRRLDDGRGHDQRPGQVRPAGARPLLAGDGVLRARHRQLPDPGDHQPVQLHREPCRAAPGRGRAERPHRARQRRPRGRRAGAGRAGADRRVGRATPTSRRPATRPRSTRPPRRRRSRARSPRRTAPGGRRGEHPGRELAGAAEGTAAAGRGPQAGRRRGVQADDARHRRHATRASARPRRRRRRSALHAEAAATQTKLQAEAAGGRR